MEDIKEKKAEILQIAKKHGASNIRVFGSYARGEQKPDSDIDFLVELQPEASLFDHVALIQDLEKLLDKKVDVVTYNSLHWLIKDKVLNEAKPI